MNCEYIRMTALGGHVLFLIYEESPREGVIKEGPIWPIVFFAGVWRGMERISFLEYKRLHVSG